MKKSPFLLWLTLFVGLWLTACRPQLTPQLTSPPPTATEVSVAATPTEISPPEQPVTVIPLQVPLARSSAEISGLAWYGDHLILLPQYPERFGGVLFTLPKADILAFLDGDLNGPLEPRPIPFSASGLTDDIQGFEGFEALATAQDRIFLTIEARGENGMMGYLVAGTIAADLGEIRLDPTLRVELRPPAALANSSDEAMFCAPEGLVTLYEANGINVNPAPVAQRFAAETFAPQGDIPFPTIEYRITDATALDSHSRFWAINYFWPGDAAKLQPGPDALAQRHGPGPTRAPSERVERLVEFQYSDAGITLVGTPPLQLQLFAGDDSRNWEGVVRLDERGFLLATDKYPDTILGFVAYKE